MCFSPDISGGCFDVVRLPSCLHSYDEGFAAVQIRQDVPIRKADNSKRFSERISEDGVCLWIPAM